MNTTTINGLVVAGTGPDPYLARVLATALHWPEDEDQYTYLSHATEVSAPTLARFPHLARLDLEGCDYSSRETAGDTAAELRAMWAHGQAVAVWDAPLALTTLATNSPGFHLPEGATVYDLRVLDRWLFPDRPGRRTLHTLADYLGVPSRTTSMAEDAHLAATLATVLLPQVQQAAGGADHMAAQAQAHRDSMAGLQGWLQKQGRPTSHLDPSWPMRADSMTDERRVELVTDWATGGTAHASEAKHALARLLGNGWTLTAP